MSAPLILVGTRSRQIPQLGSSCSLHDHVPGNGPFARCHRTPPRMPHDDSAQAELGRSHPVEINIPVSQPLR